MKSLVALFLPSVLLSAWLLNSPAAPPAAGRTDDPDEHFLREAKIGAGSLHCNGLNSLDFEWRLKESRTRPASRCASAVMFTEAREKQP